MTIEKIPAARLNPAAYNPRKDLKPGDREYEKLKRSIVEFGYVEPVIWNRRTGNVVGGHQRLKVLVDMGQTEIDCVVVDLDLRREKALNVALNKIQGDWDEEKLASLMAEFDATDFDVSLTGFEASEVDALLNRFYSHEAQEDEFDADAAQEKITENGGPVTQPGSLWALGEHRLLCADPTDPEAYERLLGNERAQCAVTSPPVDAKEYEKHGLEPWLNRMAKAIHLLARYAEVVCWQTADLMQTGSPFVEPLAMHAMKLFADETLRPLWIRVWKMTGNVPTAGALQAASNKPAPQFDYVTAYASNAPEAYNDQEYAWVSAFAAHSFQFAKRLTREERRKWGYAGVWEISAMRKQNGEAQIPIELPWRCIKMHADVHGLALDPFAGLGSTLIACEQSGRRCRALEADALHCDLIVRRWEQFTGERAIRL